MSRRGVLGGGAALGAASALGSGAFAQDRVFVPCSNKSLDLYFFVIQEEAVKRAVQSHDWEFQATDANFDNTTQHEQWQSLLHQPAALVADPIDSQAIVSAIQRAIPIGIIDTPAEGGDVAITVSFDNYLGGQMAARDHRPARGASRGAAGRRAQRLRRAPVRRLAPAQGGMDAVFAEHPDITYLARPTEGQLDQMLAVTLSTLSEYPDLDAVHAPSETPSRGIVTALQQRDRWRTRDEDGGMIFVDVDGEPIALKWIQEGFMDACVSQDPIAYGEIAVEMLARHAMQGEAVPTGPYENAKYFWETAEIVEGRTGPTMIIPPFVIDGSNADDPRHWGAVAENEWGIAYT